MKEKMEEGKEWNRNKGEREEGSKQVWWATTIPSSTAKIWDRVPNPTIPSSASELEDYKTARGLVWYPNTASHITEAEAESQRWGKTFPQAQEWHEWLSQTWIQASWS